MKRIALVKIVILVILLLVTIISHGSPNTHYPLVLSIVLPILFGGVCTFFTVKLISFFISIKIIRPNWNNTPLSIVQPLSSFHFASWILIAIGIGKIMAQFIEDLDYSQIGIILFFLGAGVLVGIKLILLIPASVRKHR